MQQMDRIEHSSGLLTHPYGPWSASRTVSGTAQLGVVAGLRQRVATQSGAARIVLQGPVQLPDPES